MEIVVRYKDKTKKVYDHFDIDKFENVEDITELYCSHNRLTSLPESMASLVNLEKLDCSYNKLTSLPESMTLLVNLKILYCDYNKLTSLPLSIINLRRLEDFNYYNNPLGELPVQIQRFIYRLKNRQNDKVRVYTDSQNVHNSEIHSSVKLSITNLMKEKSLDKFLDFV